MNITEKKFYVYSLRGLLRNRFDFNEFSKKYGKPKAVSNNGLIFIFKKGSDFDLHIVRMNQECLTHIKTINIPDSIQGCECQSSPSIKEVIESDFDDLQDPKQCKQYFQINDNMDVCIQLISRIGEEIQAKTKNNFKGEEKGIVWQLKNQIKKEVNDHRTHIFLF